MFLFFYKLHATLLDDNNPGLKELFSHPMIIRLMLL